MACYLYDTSIDTSPVGGIESGAIVMRLPDTEYPDLLNTAPFTLTSLISVGRSFKENEFCAALAIPCFNFSKFFDQSGSQISKTSPPVL